MIQQHNKESYLTSIRSVPGSSKAFFFTKYHQILQNKIQVFCIRNMGSVFYRFFIAKYYNIFQNNTSFLHQEHRVSFLPCPAHEFFTSGTYNQFLPCTTHAYTTSVIQVFYIRNMRSVFYRFFVIRYSKIIQVFYIRNMGSVFYHAPYAITKRQ